MQSKVLRGYVIIHVPLYVSLRFSFSGTNSVCKGNLGRTLQMVSTFDGTLTAGPCIERCLLEGSATIFIKGRRRQINRNSSGFRPDSSGVH